GELYSEFSITAPIDGYITNLNIMLGQFIEQQKSLIKIIDVNQLQLQLSVFENDLKELNIGQNIKFYSLGRPNTIHYARLSSVGKTINLESKTIQCIAKINNEDGFSFINNSYIEARIIINQREAKALPNEAILKSGKDYYVFIVEKSDKQIYYFRKVKVNIGSVSNEFTEIIAGEGLTKVVTNGVYNLQTNN
ncbi:MAG: efflux RND transporter periplasmic adaptor subunit, partial [Bacteroidota bacterium]|nr:efflux RND transporter periplasmic adaptor subunit [Bacteroidota bacterium]